MTNQMIVEDLSQIATTFGIELQHKPPQISKSEETYYLQFASRIRLEARRMGRHYEVFYCLEQSIREIVDQALADAKKTEDWWALDCVPSHIRTEVSSRIKLKLMPE